MRKHKTKQKQTGKYNTRIYVNAHKDYFSLMTYSKYTRMLDLQINTNPFSFYGICLYKHYNNWNMFVAQKIITIIQNRSINLLGTCIWNFPNLFASKDHVFSGVTAGDKDQKVEFGEVASKSTTIHEPFTHEIKKKERVQGSLWKSKTVIDVRKLREVLLNGFVADKNLFRFWKNRSNLLESVPTIIVLHRKK